MPATQLSKRINQETTSSKKHSSCTTWRPSPVHLRKISLNLDKVAISWNLVKDVAGLFREVTDIIGYVLYQGSSIKMWQLVGTFQALKLPVVVVVVSSCKKQMRYQIRLKILYKS